MRLPFQKRKDQVIASRKGAKAQRVDQETLKVIASFNHLENSKIKITHLISSLFFAPLRYLKIKRKDQVIASRKGAKAQRVDQETLKVIASFNHLENSKIKITHLISSLFFAPLRLCARKSFDLDLDLDLDLFVLY